MSELDSMLRNVANNDGKKPIVDSRAGLESSKDQNSDSEWDSLSSDWNDNIAGTDNAAGNESFDSFENFFGTEPLDPSDHKLMEDFNLDDLENIDDQANQKGNACFCPDEDTDQNTKVKPLGLDLSDDVLSGKTSIADTCSGPKDDLIDCSLYNECKVPEDDSFNDEANTEWLDSDIDALTENLDFVDDLDKIDESDISESLTEPLTSADTSCAPIKDNNTSAGNNNDAEWNDPAFAEFRAKEKARKEAQALAVQKEEDNFLTGTTSKGNFQYKCDGDVCTIQASDLLHSDCDNLSVNDLSNTTINPDLNLSALGESLDINDSNIAAAKNANNASNAEASCPRRHSLINRTGAGHIITVARGQKEHSSSLSQSESYTWRVIAEHQSTQIYR